MTRAESNKGCLADLADMAGCGRHVVTFVAEVVVMLALILAVIAVAVAAAPVHVDAVDPGTPPAGTIEVGP